MNPQIQAARQQIDEEAADARRKAEERKSEIEERVIARRRLAQSEAYEEIKKIIESITETNKETALTCKDAHLIYRAQGFVAALRLIRNYFEHPEMEFSEELEQLETAG